MTDDLARYEALAESLRHTLTDPARFNEADIRGLENTAVAITELVAMVRAASRDTSNSVDRQFEWKRRAEAAERELADIKRKINDLLLPKPKPKEIAVAARAHEPTFECPRCHVVSYSGPPWCNHDKCPRR